MDIGSVLDSGLVQRFHTVPGITKQTVAEHSWGVANLCQYFAPDCRKELIMAALWHDCAEIETGDLPATIKWANPRLKLDLNNLEEAIERDMGIQVEITEEECRLLKLCDSFEGMRYCLHRMQCGERPAGMPFTNWADFIRENYTLCEKEQEYFHALLTMAEDTL